MAELSRPDGEVAAVDTAIAQLRASFARHGRRAAWVVTADHGEAFGEHGMSWHGVELWEELVRVPWIMRVPGLREFAAWNAALLIGRR